ncbi:MAG: CRTAC1 family protein, partial [Deltaproteobacteria bacterium]|nr:CRTAC1 family protein [Deltaproteobacteria bacterium]
LNDGDGTFTSHEIAAFVGNQGRGGSVADYDGDGAMDVFLWRWNQDSRLLRNTARDDHHWLELKLVGQISNRDAIGAEVVAVANGVTMRRRVTGGDSAHSQGDLAVHFGLGTATSAEVSIRWPSGIEQALGTLAADRFHAADELAGPILEVLTGTTTWDDATGALEIRVTSTLRGRSAVDAAGWGAVPWVASERAYVLSANSADDPGGIEVTGGSGGAVVIVPE